MKELQAIARTLRAGTAGPAALATLVSVEGSSYRRPGARLLLRADGTRLGSISGGCLEDDLLLRARHVLATGVAETVVYDTTAENDLVWGVGLGCHGVVRILVERLDDGPAWAHALATHAAARQPTFLRVAHAGPAGAALGTREATPEERDQPALPGVFLQRVEPPTALVIFGAGDDAQPLARLALELGWEVTVADARPALATAERFPGATCVVAPAEELPARVRLDAASLAVLMTHRYVHDRPILGALLGRPLAYLGLLGPRQRAHRILDDLAAAGLAVTPAERARLHAPVGLDLGADGPEPVALSILAEMQAVLAGRDARPLRERTRPIHG